MIIVTGSITARPDTLDALRQASLDHVHRSRTEDGCLHHSVHIDGEDPLRLFFYEQWRDRAALEVHFHAPGSVAFIGQVRALAAATQSVTMYDASSLAT